MIELNNYNNFSCVLMQGLMWDGGGGGGQDHDSGGGGQDQDYGGGGQDQDCGGGGQDHDSGGGGLDQGLTDQRCLFRVMCLIF